MTEAELEEMREETRKYAALSPEEKAASEQQRWGETCSIRTDPNGVTYVQSFTFAEGLTIVRPGNPPIPGSLDEAGCFVPFSA